MKLNKILMGGVLAASLFATGCSLEVKPDYALDIDDANKYPADQINGVMNSMYGVAYYGRNAYIFGDIGTDNIVEGENNSNRFIFESRMEKYEAMPNSVGSGETNLYDHIYKVINLANRVIVNPEADDNYKGQAYFLRALASFDAVRFFDAVPLVLKPVESIEDAVNFRPENDQMEVVYNQVIADLEMAASMITNEEVTAPTQNAANALLSRVYLYIADEVTDFAKIESLADRADALAHVVAAADKVAGVDMVGANDFEEYFWNQGNNATETIFELAVVESQSRGSDNFGYIYYMDAGGSGYGAYTANPEFINLFDDADVRKKHFVEVDPNKPGWQYIYKFAQTDGVTGMHAPKILRFTEVMLNKAEALMETKPAEAAAIIQSIRDARYTSAAPTVEVANIENEVFTERRKELAYEGHYMFDLRRHNMGVTLVRLVDGSKDKEVEELSSIPAGDKQFWFPIPQRSMLANTSLVQPKY
ncbi:RagB/SusD family nutrient uptake outer membrane protein [Persicobacter sp. CCB-QB2]|uniref:RagB/SusD family nutrient uptake outer membrane protein n=1 Tax=Persicobacter sp. CCB-QB2 TaxID=1561025 RepID=UPI0006A963D8|nr:RagB/SusD family nutrient uptake outer membrane protein [Persicobacter sp. CCB-QB2]